tara:strand:+ start:312 stop:545 length:234 start_codon:yes stop_codon:yes gene_type:complete
MNKLSILPVFFLTMCAPAPVTPPAEAIPQEQMEQIWEALEYMKEYDMLQNRTEPDDAITSALDDFWGEIDTLDEEQE